MTSNVTFSFVFLILSSSLLGNQATRAPTTLGSVTMTPTEDETTADNTVITSRNSPTTTISSANNASELVESTTMPSSTENLKSDDQSTETYKTNPTSSTPTPSLEYPSNLTTDIRTTTAATVEGGKELESPTSSSFANTTPIMTTGTATLSSVTDATTTRAAYAVTTRSSTTTNAPAMTTSTVSPYTKELPSEERTTELFHPETLTVTAAISSITTSESLTESPSTTPNSSDTTTDSTNGISTTEVDANYATTDATDQPSTYTPPSIVEETTTAFQLSTNSSGPGTTTRETTEGETSQSTSTSSSKTTESVFNKICLERDETMNQVEEVQNLISVVMVTRKNIQIIDLKKRLVQFVVDTMNDYFEKCGQRSTTIPSDSMVSSGLKTTDSESRVVAFNDVVILNEARFDELLTIAITFYVKDRRNPANCTIFPAFFVLNSVKRKRSQLESLLECNITQILVGSVQRWKESMPDAEEHYDWKIFNTRYEPLIFALMAVVGVCLSVAIVAALWIRCSRLNGSYSSEDGYGLERDILKEVNVKTDEFDGKDLTSEREILHEERDTDKMDSEDLTVVKEHLRPRNLNLTLITADDGWVVPFKDIQLDSKVIRPSQDTKL